MTELPEQQANLYKFFQAYPVDTDLRIVDLWLAMYATRNINEMNDTDKQRYVGACISRLNKKILHHNLRIVPGKLKRTYRLTKVNI